MSNFSRDETEFGAFEDPSAPIVNQPAWGDSAAFGLKLPGFMRKTLQKASGNKVHIPKNATINVKQSLGGLAKGVSIGVGLASFVVPGVGLVTGSAALGGLVAADKLVAAGQKGVAAAHSVVDTTKKLAAAGHIDAQRGLQLLGVAADLRAKAGIAPGVPMPVNAAGQLAHAQFLAARKPVVVAAPKAPAPKAPAPPPQHAAAPPPRMPYAASQLAAVPMHAPVMARPVAPYPMAAPVAPRPAPVAVAAPKPAPAPVAHDWVVHDSGQVVRVVRGQAVATAGGWYAGPSGVVRLGVRA